MSRSLITRIERLEAAGNTAEPRIHLWLRRDRAKEDDVTAVDLAGAWINRSPGEPLDDFQARAIQEVHGDAPPAVVVGIFQYENTNPKGPTHE